MMRHALSFAATATCAFGASVTVGAIDGHSPSAWAKEAADGCGSAKGKDLHNCNLKVYAAAAAAAAGSGVQLLVFSEGYALGNSAMRNDYYEPLDDSAVGTALCDMVDGDERPAQKVLSCAARSNGIALAANAMTHSSNGTKHISELVFDTQGTLLSIYHKHTLFPNEGLLGGITAGPFAPTTFDLFGQRWGSVICYEGIKPFVPILGGDFSQFEGLVAEGASAFVWSVGGSAGLLSGDAVKMAHKYGVGVVSTEGSNTAIVDATGEKLQPNAVAIDGLLEMGYTNEAVVQVATLNFDEPVPSASPSPDPAGPFVVLQ